MRRVSWKSVYEQCLRKIGTSIATPQGNTDDAEIVKGLINARARFAWESFFWPEWTQVERRFYRPVYSSATSYSAATEVFFWGTKKYYQSLRGTAFSGQDPADANGVENSAYWAECKPEYSGSDWATATSYAAGDVRFYKSNGNFYQCHTAHTSSGSLTPDATGASERWGLLTDFVQSVSLEQTGQTVIETVRNVWTGNPRAHRGAYPIDFFLGEDLVYVVNGPSIVWVEFRERAPTWLGADWDEDSTYAVNDTVYFQQGSAYGDFYLCAQATSAGESPATAAAKWTRLDFPYVLSEYVAQGVFSDYTGKPDQRTEVQGYEGDEAFGILIGEWDKIQRQQQQQQPLRVAVMD